MRIGNQLKALRKEAGLSFKDLGVHPRSISAIENDRFEYSIASLKSYIEAIEKLTGYSISIQCAWGEKKKENSTGHEPAD